MDIEAGLNSYSIGIVRDKIRQFETALSRIIGEKLVVSDIYIEGDSIWVEIELPGEATVYLVYENTDKPVLNSVILVSDNNLISLQLMAIMKKYDLQASILEDNGKMIFVFSHATYSVVKKIVYTVKTGLLN